MPNRLAQESSPYLRQHKDNPVDWLPWCEEAFDRAKAENKPVFLSVGYSSCHWCHVMEHESFEDPEIAAMLNEGFVSVKVDREERPDVDEAYMTAVQLSSGHGGWPMSVFMTPDRRPIFAGTYFPKEDRGQYPGFKTILQELQKVWQNDRTRVEETAQQFDEAMRGSIGQELSDEVAIGPDLFDACVQKLSMDFDEELGGFGSAPKFPPHSALEFLLNYALVEEAPEDLRQAAADMAFATLHKMSFGGIHDHVGGGFHRYSTDERWLLPHFEKMLYDNALLLGNYARAASICHEQMPEVEQHFNQTAEGIIGWVKREMTSPEGLFYSALDADSEGEEGKYYTWTEAEIREALGEEAKAFIEAYQVHPSGNFHDEATGKPSGTNILHLLEPVGTRFERELQVLGERRSARVRPGLDDKAIIGWNGLMIGALAEAGEIGLAERAASTVLEFEKGQGSLPRHIIGGKALGEGFLEDYAYFTDGLLALVHAKSLFEENFPERKEGRASAEWLGEAERLARTMIDKFYDQVRGGFFATNSDHEVLFGRSKPVFDQPIPSANAIAIRVLVDLGEDELARKSLLNCRGWMARAPLATEALHLAAIGLGAIDDEVELSVESIRLEGDRIEGEIHISVPEGRYLSKLAVSGEPEIQVQLPAAIDGKHSGHVAASFTGERSDSIALNLEFEDCSDLECRLVRRQIDVPIPNA